MKMHLDAFPRIDLRHGKNEVDVLGSDYSRPLCKHIIAKHEILRGNFFYNRYYCCLYGEEKYVVDSGTKSRYRIIDSDIEFSRYFGDLHFYIPYDHFDEFSYFIRNYLDSPFHIKFLLITCFECGLVGFSSAREFRNRKKYLAFKGSGDKNICEIGRNQVFMFPRIDTIDGTIKDMVKEKNIDERILNLIGKKKVYEFFFRNRFNDMELMWIVNREVFKN